MDEVEELSLDELNAKIADLQAQVVEKQKDMLRAIGTQIEECAPSRGVDVEIVLLEIGKHYGYVMTKIVAAKKVGSARKGKPSVKQPLKDKLTAAGIKFSPADKVATLQELVASNNL